VHLLNRSEQIETCQNQQRISLKEYLICFSEIKKKKSQLDQEGIIIKTDVIIKITSIINTSPIIEETIQKTVGQKTTKSNVKVIC
jgi:hypothetical protein